MAGEDYLAFRQGPDHDRLIALAIGREDWTEILRLVRLGEPDPLGGKDVVFGGGSRAKGPLVKLTAYAVAATGDRSMARDMGRYFGLDGEEVEVFLQHARSGAYAKDVAKLGKPPMLRVAARTLDQIMEQGRTARSMALAKFLETLEPDFRAAHDSVTRWLRTGDDAELEPVIFWLTRLDSLEVFKSCLFALQCETGMSFETGPRQVAFYSSHPWLARAAMRELLAALVAMDGMPTPAVLFSCVLQHSASITQEIETGTFDPDRVNPVLALRAHPVWAEAVIARWAADGTLDPIWTRVREEAGAQVRVDVRRMRAFGELCETLSAELLSAWSRDFEVVRWKAEESAFLSLRSLLPGVEVRRHARPTWLAPQHLDMLVPDAGVAIEYQGEQHYRPIKLFGGDAGYAATVRRDENKRRLCNLAGVTLEYIRFDEDASERIRQIAGQCRALLGK